MHKIIKPGKKELITKPIYEATCGKCGCKFEFDDEEITKRTKNLSKNALFNTIWVNCPCCGNELEINNPKVVREEPIHKIDYDKCGSLDDVVNTVVKEVKKRYELEPGLRVVDKEQYEKMKKQLKVVREKVLPLVYIDPKCKKSPYRVYDNELYQYEETTKEEYNLLLDLKGGNKNEQTK